MLSSTESREYLNDLTEVQQIILKHLNLPESVYRTMVRITKFRC